MPKDEQIKNSIITVFMVAIGLIFATLLIVSYTGTEVNQENTCGFNYYTDVTRQTYSLSDYVITQSGEEVLQLFRVEENNNLKYEFCFDINHSGSGVTLEIVNINESIATVYADSSTRNYCVLLPEEKINENNYLGVNCVDCSQNNNVTVYKQPLGDSVLIINKMGIKDNACEWFANESERHLQYSNNFTTDDNHHWYNGEVPSYNPPDFNSPATIFLFHEVDHVDNWRFVCETEANETILSISKDATLHYTLLGHKDCKGYVSFFTRWLYIALGIIAMLLVLLVGFRNLKHKFLEGW